MQHRLVCFQNEWWATYHECHNRCRLVEGYIPGNLSGQAVEQAIKPETNHDGDEKEAELEADRQTEYNLVHSVDRQRGANTLECLPAKELERRCEHNCRGDGHNTNLDQLPCQKGRDKEGKTVERQCGVLSLSTLLPVIGEKGNSTASTVSDGPVEALAEVVSVVDLEARPGGSQNVGEQ